MSELKMCHVFAQRTSLCPAIRIRKSTIYETHACDDGRRRMQKKNEKIYSQTFARKPTKSWGRDGTQNSLRMK